MRKILLSILLSFLSLSVVAQQDSYKSYISKVFSEEAQIKRSFESLENSTELDRWLKQVDEVLDTDRLITYKAKLNFSLDYLGNIDSLSILELGEYDFDKFKDFISDLSAIQFPETKIDLTNFNFVLEGNTLYLQRPEKIISKKITSQEKDIQEKLSFTDGFTLHKPRFLDYPYIGQEIIIKNPKDLYLKTYVSQKKGNKLELIAYQAFDDDEVIKLNERLELEKSNDKNFIAKVIGSGFANGLKAGLITSYQTYGAAPAALALMGMTGRALMETETEDSFAFSKGESMKIKKAEEK